MVQTRTQDGTIPTKAYSPLALDLNALSMYSAPSSPAISRAGPHSPSRAIRPRTPRRTSDRVAKTPTSVKKFKFDNVEASLANAAVALGDAAAAFDDATVRSRTISAASSAATLDLQQEEPVMDYNQTDWLNGNTFFPSISIGGPEKVGLSKIGRADKEVKMWETIVLEHEKNLPELVPVVQKKLEEAKTKRLAIDEEHADNWMVGSINPAQIAIAARLETLRRALSTSTFAPEAANIACAIAAYESGAIGYNAHFTVIYAAHIVDTVDTYAAFVKDRKEMLERYAEMHGEGWLWYESPLHVPAHTKPHLYACTMLSRTESWSALGGYFVNQGFWKRSGFVARMASTLFTRLADNVGAFKHHPFDYNLWDCQQDGPRMAFVSVLDSGATYPSLHTEDFANLDIDFNNYSAQSVQTVMTANGEVDTRLFELFVCVLDDKGNQLVDAADPVYPNNHTYLGGLCPVALSIVPLTWDEHGKLPTRLSGILPFLACYSASTPGRNKLFLGEDRNDVLGSHRTPGQKKWSIEMPAFGVGVPFERYGNPLIRFSHRDGQITDADEGWDGTSWPSPPPDPTLPPFLPSPPPTQPLLNFNAPAPANSDADLKWKHRSLITFKDRVTGEMHEIPSDPGTRSRELAAARARLAEEEEEMQRIAGEVQRDLEHAAYMARLQSRGMITGPAFATPEPEEGFNSGDGDMEM